MKIKSLLVGLSLSAGFLISLDFVQAQEATTSTQGNLSDAQIELQAIESQPSIPFAQLSESDLMGTFYSAQHSPVSLEPWPALPTDIRQLPVWSLGSDSQGNSMFLIDDLTVNYNLASSLQTAGVMQPMDGSEDPLSSANTNFTISAQGPNILLHWTSETNRIYLLEQRATLTADTHWSELTDYYLSAANTNVTTFVHSNIVQLQPINFYRLFDVTPVAHSDFFAVNQNSSANQLDVLQNDSSPNDDFLYIASATQPLHGSITSTSSNIVYTPNTGFYGTDTFTYNVTSGYGDISSNVTVSVFVNESGNTSPTVNNLIFTLQTNVYSVTFNALTNTTGNTPVLYAVNQPSMGSVSNDASGNITYTRNPNLFGDDVFTYILTDANGGYAVVTVRIQQQDTSSDGLSDQWDLQYGFDPAVDNSMANPAGDGLPNLAKFVLGLDPTKADNALNFSSVTNGMQISGFAQLPIYGLSSSIQTPPIILYVNGLPAEDSVLSQGPDGVWQMNWDTTFLTNGDYQIQLVCPVAPTSSPDSITNVMGTAVTVQVNNPITMDKLTHQFSSYLYIYGTLADTNDTFDVYLYDDYGNPLVYATGLSAPNGQIAIGWDLTDGNGNQISFGNIQAVFYLHPPGGSGPISPNDSSPSPIFSTWFLKSIANAGGNFAVAWAWNSYGSQFNNNESQMISDGVVNILGNPSDINSYNLLPVANVPYGGTTFRFDSDFDKTVMMHAIQDSGNLFWLGHSSGAGVIFGNEKHSYIGIADVETWLGNLAFASTPKHPRNNNHPYHLVILDGCQTYYSSWATAFGIDFSPGGSFNSKADYDAVGRPEGAFVGWTQLVYLPAATDFTGLAHAQYGEALGYLNASWMAGYPLYYCLGQFASDAISNGFTGAESWQISGCVDLTRQ